MSRLSPAFPGTQAGPGGLLDGLRGRHPVWARWGLIYLAAAAISLVMTTVDGRTLYGVSVWSKPFKFELSLAVYFLTLAWFAPLLPSGYFQTRTGRALTWTAVVTAALEMVYIIHQAAWAEPSHFNVSTPFHAAAYSLMGLGAVILVSICLWLGVALLRRLPAHGWGLYPAAVGIGLVLTFVLGGGFGAYLGGSDGHWVGGVASDAGGLPLFNWVRDGGDLRVAHFFGMHAMQLLPLAGWLLRGWPRAEAWVALLVAGGAYTLWCVKTFIDAVHGSPFIGI